MRKLATIILLFSLFGACTQNNSRPNKEARNFKITENAGGYNVEVINPSTMQKQTFVLSRSSKKGTIHIPVKKVACLSTTYLSYIETLGEDSTVIAVSGKNLIYSPQYNKRINDIAEIGYEQMLDVEKILELKPDVLFVYDLNETSDKKFDILRKAGIAVVPVYEYLENTPSGRLEWIKFFGAFFDKTELAYNYFDSVSANYKKIAKLSTKAAHKPHVLVNIPYQSVWYLPSGNSYMAHFLKDAAADYKWDNAAGTGSISLGFETVLLKSKNADFLINTSDAKTIREILERDPRMKMFKAIQTGQVYNNNKRTNPNGGLDFWESGPVHPDIILADLVKIFHPELIPEHQLFYYQKLDK